MKKKLHHTIYYYITLSFLLLFFIFVSFSLVMFQTDIGKKYAKIILITQAKLYDIKLEIKSLTGLLPFEYKLQNVSIQYENKKIDIENLNFRVKFWPLLRKELSFRLFEAKNILVENIESQNNKTVSLQDVNWFSPKFKIVFDKLNIEAYNYAHEKENIKLDLKGKILVEKNGREIESKIVISRSDYKSSKIKLDVKGRKIDRYLNVLGELNLESLKVIEPFIEIVDFDLEMNTTFKAYGKLDSFSAFFSSSNQSISKIDGILDGKILVKNEKASEKVKKLINIEHVVSLDFTIAENQNIKFFKGILGNELYEATFDSVVTKKFNLKNLNLILNIEELTKLNIFKTYIEGSLLAKINLEDDKLSADYVIKKIILDQFLLEDVKGEFLGSYTKNSFNCKFKNSLYAFNQPLTISGNVFYKDNIYDFTNLQATAPSSTFNGKLNLNKENNLIGSLTGDFNDLSQIKTFFPEYDFNSQLTIKTDFDEKIINDKKTQYIKCSFSASDFHINNFFGKNLTCNLEVFDLFNNRDIKLNVISSNVKFHDLFLDNFDFNINGENNFYPFHLSAKASSKKPFEININGNFSIKDKLNQINITAITGEAFLKKYSTEKSIFISFNKENLNIENFLIKMNESSLDANIKINKDHSKIIVKADHFPLDFLSLNPFDLSVEGKTTFEFDFEKNGVIKSLLNLNIEDVIVKSFADSHPVNASGTIKGTVEGNYLQLTSDIKLLEDQKFKCNVKIPFEVTFLPFKFTFNREKDISGDIDYNGRIEDILDFINIGPQRMEGDIKMSMHLKRTLTDPDLKGFCDITNAIYENFYLGTYLKDISAIINLEDDEIILQTLSGYDKNKSNFSANGKISLSENKNYPYLFNTKFTNLLCINTQNINAKATCDIQIVGNKNKARASGNVKVDELLLSIPEKLPANIPNLNPQFVTITNQNLIKPVKLKPSIYPLELDLNVDATNPISISGGGLDSTWQGSFKIYGTYMNVQTLGELKLIKGSYAIAIRSFNLTDGHVIFTGVPNANPDINLRATTNMQNVEINIEISGSLDSPKLLLYSKPPLPASSILSILLFGKNVPQLSPDQTVNLVNMMNQKLSETALNESEPNSLGTNKYTVVQPTTTDPMGSNQVGLEFGSYITRGVVVSFSQGQEQGSSNIIIDLSIKGGFYLQLEQQQTEEQGKFSLKYRTNY
ncbi:MAG: hypothetical protein A2888_03380 [Chlamydiae bacterium RIFCSPLOWO2_01_FULL_28_7]|nr:MAG: hypothetical protein A2888_03380 [Chlamydiae bacterium RIFCSPLOWO2_01_FULL_28_7]